jgi:antitoxin YefM
VALPYPASIAARLLLSASYGDARKVVPHPVPILGGVPVAITVSESRKNLLRLIEQVNDDRQPIEVRSKRGDAVLLSRADYDALTETAFLLRVPANARRLLESVAQARSGEREAHVVE